MIFHRALKITAEPVHVYCSPSKYTGFDAKKWWSNKEGIQRVIMEYIKLINFWDFDKWELRKKT